MSLHDRSFWLNPAISQSPAFMGRKSSMNEQQSPRSTVARPIPWLCRLARKFRDFPLDSLRLRGKGETKDGADSQLRFHPDSSTMPLHDPLADGQTDAGAGDFLSVKPLKDSENSFVILRRNSNPVVAHREKPLLAVHLRGHAD